MNSPETDDGDSREDAPPVSPLRLIFSTREPRLFEQLFIAVICLAIIYFVISLYDNRAYDPHDIQISHAPGGLQAVVPSSKTDQPAGTVRPW